MNIELHPQAAEVAPRTSLEEFETWLGLLLEAQRDVLWQIGDLALAVERQHPSTYHQAYPVWASPDLIARCKAVSAAYKPDERNINATWSIHKNHCKAPDRVALVEAAVEAGQTSDENRRDPAVPETQPVVEEAPAVTQETAPPAAEPAENGWLLAVDVNYYIHSYFHSGAGVESAYQFDAWLARLVERLQAKGLTDIVCCLDSRTNHRKALTEHWEHGYKGNRGQKDEELAGQVRLAPDLLRKRNLAVVSIEDMEADDVMASYAAQFAGRVTLLTKDKDMRQCLSSTCNILLDVTWEENTETGSNLPVYKWLSAKLHTDETGLRPDQWICKQTLFGDAVDNIKGATNIGDVGATKLVLEFGSAKDAVEAAKRNDPRLLAMPRGKIMAAGLMDFEERMEITRQLVALRTDLNVPQITRIS